MYFVNLCDLVSLWHFFCHPAFAKASAGKARHKVTKFHQGRNYLTSASELMEAH
jgi:hypothetical protein